MPYLCTRNQEITSECKGSGALVQLVRIRACHARGQGFESPTHRTKEDNRMVVFFFFVSICEGNVDCINYVLCTVSFCVQAHNVTLHNTSLCDICPREKQRCVWHSHVKAGVARINILLLAMLRIRYPRFGFAVRVPYAPH